MSRKMTIVFHDDELYTDLKTEAKRRHVAASHIVVEAIREWLDAREDEELLPIIKASLKEYEERVAALGLKWSGSGKRNWRGIGNERRFEADT